MLVRVLDITTWVCGCVVGRYHDLEHGREVAYIERKGARCDVSKHRRNHAVLSGTLRPAMTAGPRRRVA